MSSARAFYLDSFKFPQSQLAYQLRWKQENEFKKSNYEGKEERKW